MEDTIKRYHECYYRNRNGTRKLIDIARGDNCVCATVNPFWRPVKLKYLRVGITIRGLRVRTLKKK